MLDIRLALLALLKIADKNENKLLCPLCLYLRNNYGERQHYTGCIVNEAMEALEKSIETMKKQ